MQRWLAVPVMAALLTACVTINVYFPAAEAREAAREFVEKVISEDGTTQPAPQEKKSGGPNASLRPVEFDWLALIGIGSAHAQTPDFNIRTPAIQAIQARMEARFDSELRAAFDAGALGFARDGTVVVRDAAKLELKDRVAVNQAVAEENRDRKALYREVAVANGHPEWEGQVRDVFARQWIASARAGWWYQDAGGAWKQK
ncbi:MAG TPA: YdbL family protein [Lysobacter sp.]|nr:YdbL family protein [Lysobacter sp.]